MVPKEVTTRQLFRIKSQLVGLIPSKPFGHLDIFFQYLQVSTVQGSNLISSEYKFMGTLTERQRRYRANAVSTLFMKYSEDIQNTLLKYWINRISCDNLIGTILQSYSTQFPLEFLPKSINVSLISKNLAEKSLSSCRSTNEQRKVGVHYLISVAKQAGLKFNTYGDTQILMNATACSWNFADTVLKAISEGIEDQLLTRNVRCESIKATEWPDKIASFVFQPENSRAMPGQDTVSVRYGVRRPKFLLMKSRTMIAQLFLELNPDC